MNVLCNSCQSCELWYFREVVNCNTCYVVEHEKEVRALLVLTGFAVICIGRTSAIFDWTLYNEASWTKILHFIWCSCAGVFFVLLNRDKGINSSIYISACKRILHFIAYHICQLRKYFSGSGKMHSYLF